MRMLCTQGFLKNANAARIKRLGVSETTLVLIDIRKVIEGGGNIGMFRP